MDSSLNLNAWNLVVLIGALHGLMISLLLVLSQRNRKSGNIMLSLMLLFYTLPVLRVVLHDMGFIRSLGYSFLSVELLYGLGPSLYLYTKTLTNAQFHPGKPDLLHFLPVVLEIIYYSSPFYQRHEFYFFADPINTDHLIWMMEQAGGMISVFVYLFLTNRTLMKYSKWIRDNHSDIHKRTLSWLQKPVFLYTIFFVLWFSLRAIDVLWFGDRLDISNYYPFLLFLSLGTYWIGTQGYLHTQTLTTGFYESREKKATQKDDQAQLNLLFEELEKVMSRDKPYLDSDLSLAVLANHLQINQRLLSEVINSQAEASFYEYINGYRIEAFKQSLLADGDKLPIINLAYDCGFGSKATFNHAFKKNTGVTPSQYRKYLQNQCPR
ncbi:AraC family transcriptional regulator [Sphingorhabdus sp. EL138]|uniref:helix-turn-helix domain-containing protein n=1 Tax=Sphingorhabdus sp. EL138 TaxID=2073156 RepID=UPI000D6926CD|nr:helix-turn-helix domain-containing protein [Sphingorhabdus sp. EL138]